MKSTVTANKKANSILNRIDITKGTPHWGDSSFLYDKSYSFECNNGTFITAKKYKHTDKVTHYSITITSKSQIYGTYLNCTNQRAKKIYDAILALFKEHGTAPYKNWEY